MPSLVPSAGITMDERIRNLMKDRGHEDLLFQVDDPDLEDRLYDALGALRADRDALAPGLGRCVARNLRRMARMGLFLEEEVRRRFPEFPTREGLVSWEDYLPPLAPELRRLVEAYGDAEDAALPSTVSERPQAREP
jgi:hypothetical protein